MHRAGCCLQPAAHAGMIMHYCNSGTTAATNSVDWHTIGKHTSDKQYDHTACPRKVVFCLCAKARSSHRLRGAQSTIRQSCTGQRFRAQSPTAGFCHSRSCIGARHWNIDCPGWCCHQKTQMQGIQACNSAQPLTVGWARTACAKQLLPCLGLSHPVSSSAGPS